MKSIITLITIAIFFVSNVEAQMVYDLHDVKHSELIKEYGKKTPSSFQILDKEAKVLNYVEVCKKIEYPDVAYQAGLEGLVQVRILVDEAGKVSKYQIYGGHRELNKAVEKHIKSLSFEPAIHKSKNVPSWNSVKFRFTLRG